MVAELFVTEDREFQTAGAMILNALDWKLISAATTEAYICTIQSQYYSL